VIIGCDVGERSSTGLIQWDDRHEAIEALVVANHSHLPNPSMRCVLMISILLCSFTEVLNANSLYVGDF